MDANRVLTLAYHLFITPVTATKVHNGSMLWAPNAFWLWFNRQVGFRRRNLGKAIALAKRWLSVGDIFGKMVAETKLHLVLIPGNDVNQSLHSRIRRQRLLFRCS
jgi:hypothetical protein